MKPFLKIPPPVDSSLRYDFNCARLNYILCANSWRKLRNGPLAFHAQIRLKEACVRAREFRQILAYARLMKVRPICVQQTFVM